MIHAISLLISLVLIQSFSTYAIAWSWLSAATQLTAQNENHHNHQDPKVIQTKENTLYTLVRYSALPDDAPPNASPNDTSPHWDFIVSNASDGSNPQIIWKKVRGLCPINDETCMLIRIPQPAPKADLVAIVGSYGMHFQGFPGISSYLPQVTDGNSHRGILSVFDPEQNKFIHQYLLTGQTDPHQSQAIAAARWVNNQHFAMGIFNNLGDLYLGRIQYGPQGFSNYQQSFIEHVEPEYLSYFSDLESKDINKIYIGGRNKLSGIQVAAYEWNGSKYVLNWKSSTTPCVEEAKPAGSGPSKPQECILNFDEATSLALDESGHLYVVGTSGKPLVIDAGKLEDQAPSPSAMNVFIAKFNPNGLASWVKNWHVGYSFGSLGPRIVLRDNDIWLATQIFKVTSIPDFLANPGVSTNPLFIAKILKSDGLLQEWYSYKGDSVFVTSFISDMNNLGFYIGFEAKKTELLNVTLAEGVDINAFWGHWIPPVTDLNGDGKSNVADAMCHMLYILHLQSGSATKPACASQVLTDAQLDYCPGANSTQVNVGDLLALVGFVVKSKGIPSIQAYCGPN